MAVPTGRLGTYMPPQGGVTTILDAGEATLTTGGSVTVTVTTPTIGCIIALDAFSTSAQTTGSVGALSAHSITSGTSFKVKSTTTNDRRKIHWEIRSISA